MNGIILAAMAIAVQPLIDAAPAGTTITLTAGTYDGFAIAKPLAVVAGEPGVVIEGRIVARNVAGRVALRGLDVRNIGTPGISNSLSATTMRCGSIRRPRAATKGSIKR